MDVTLLLVQGLNGLQLGVMLFLLAAGLTLVFGIMNLINLAHGSMYMLGAYLAATFQGWTDSFMLGVILAIPLTFAIGMMVEMVALRTLYNRLTHLDQVLATFGLILFFQRASADTSGVHRHVLWRYPRLSAARLCSCPACPTRLYRLAVVGVGLLTAVGLYGVIQHTRLGMWIRAGASNRTMIAALGVNITWLYTLVIFV